jgi:hypothetical protein
MSADGGGEGCHEGVPPDRAPTPAATAATSAMGDVQDHDELTAVRQRLVEIYTQHKPRKLQDLDELLGEWVGKEEVLLAKVEAKYLASSQQEDGERVCVVYQNQRKNLMGPGDFSGANLYAKERTEWSDDAGNSLQRESMLPPGWSWVSEWSVVTGPDTDEEGWT